MNEFNPFETLGIDPNESMPSIIPLDTKTQVNPIETAWQFNPFEQFNINVNWFQQPTANGKDTEVSSMLWIKQFTPMTDDEKQSYVDALSDDDWNTWNQLKSEWYSFEARKALMENQDMLYDISTPWTWKYLQTQQREPITSTGAQRYIDIYQDRIAWFWDRFEDRVMNKVLYKNNGEERSSKLIKGVGGFAWTILSKWAQLIDDMLNIDAHRLEMMNNLRIIQWKQDVDTRAEMDKTKESYKSVDKSGTWIISKSVWLWFDIAYWVPALILNTLAQGDWPVAKLINWVWELVTGASSLTVDTVANLMMNDPKIQEYINNPANEWMLDDFKEWLSYVWMMIMWKYLKRGWKAFGESKAGMMMNQFRTRFVESLKSAIRKGKEGWERAQGFNESEWIEGTAAWRSNVRRATIEGLKQWRKERWNQETPIEEQPWLPDTRITPYEEKPWLSTEVKNEVQPTPTRTNTDLAKIAEETKLSENNINNLKSNPDLQTEFRNTIKPYLEANWKSNPEWVISEPVSDLVYDIKAWIDELRVQQANLNRSINNKKLTPVEKALIKEIEKIINKKEPKQIFNWLKKLTPEQLWLLERTVPNLSQRIQTIWQMLDLTMEITKNDLVWRFLRFQAERPRKGITWFAKKLLYDYVKDLYDQRWIQSSTESIDRFIDSLSDQQKSDIVKTIENSNWELSDSVKKSLSDIVNEMEVEWEPTEIRRLNESEKTEDIKRNRDQLEDEWYTPETRLYTVDKNGKLVSHEVSKELEIKPFGSDKQLKDIFKTAWVNLTIPSELMFKIRYAKDADWVYIWDKDLIAVPWKSVAVWILAHEFWHRVMAQLTENEKLKIIEDIKKKNYWMTDKAAEERFAEYFRNYFLYWNIYGVTALETFTTAVWQKAWQRIVNIMEKTKMDLFADLWANSEIDMYQKTKSIDKMIDSIYKLKEKGTEIITRETEQWSRALAEEEAARNIWTLEKFSKSDIQSDLDLSEIKKATNELKNIHINDDGYVVWDYHWHETPVYDYIEDSNLPKDLKEYLKKQETSYLEEQNKWILDKLEELEKDSLFQGNDWEIKYSSEWNLKLWPWYYFGWRKQAWEFGKNLTKLEKQEWWKFYEPKDTQTYQVEASKYGWKEKYNEYLKEQGYDWIKAMNKAFWDYEYNFFTNPIK